MCGRTIGETGGVDKRLEKPLQDRYLNLKEYFRLLKIKGFGDMDTPPIGVEMTRRDR
jgi:hypothetical protein